MIIKALATIIGLLVVSCLLIYGTISPCGILRETTRHNDKIAAILPDSWVDGLMTLHYGALSPARCIALLTVGDTQQSPVPRHQKQQQPTQQVQSLEQIQNTSAEVRAVQAECRNKRLTGQLKTFEASANCSNPSIQEIFQNIHYPYMDLIGQFIAKRLETAERIDAGKITEGEAQLELAKFITYLTDIERQRNMGHR